MYLLVITSVILLSSFTDRARAQTCKITNPCPAATPCCSEYGFCGTDSFCLGGCNPLGSNSLDSCKPNPVCQNAVHNFADDSRILSNATYFDGNATEYDWVVDQGNILNTNSLGGELALLLTESNGGTLISSTRYVHYGTVTATMKSGRWGGVVVAFIFMSDIKDEIDWEFPGNSTTSAQTNYFWQGYVSPTVHDGETKTGIKDTYGSYHAYTIDWQPQSLTFLIDGQTVRTIQQSDTVDSQGVSRFPNTPSRIQLSIWPAGIPGNAQGTIDWAGGMINWSDPDYVSAGHFQTLIQSVTVQCADPIQPGPTIMSYIYGANTTLEAPSILLSNETTLLNDARAASGEGLQLLAAMVSVAGLMLTSYVL